MRDEYLKIRYDECLGFDFILITYYLYMHIGTHKRANFEIVLKRNR